MAGARQRQEPPPEAEQYVERPSISFKDVGGIEKLKEEIRMKIIYPSMRPEVYRMYGKPLGGGILLYGPPWGVDQGLKKQSEIAAKEALERKQQEVIQTAKGRIDAAIALVPDFQETVDGADIIVPPAIAGYMQKSELFAELGYYLAKNPDVLTSIAKLAPDEQLVKIGKIEDKLGPFSKKSLTNENGKSKKDATDDESVEWKRRNA